MTDENVTGTPAPAAVSVQDFIDLTEKVYALKSPEPFKLTDDSDWKSLVAEFTELATKVAALEANAKASVPVASTSPDTSALEAQVADITSRLETFNRRSGQHI